MTIERGYNLALARVKERQRREAQLAAWLLQHQVLINQFYRTAQAIAEIDPIHFSCSVDSSPSWGPDHEVLISVIMRQLQGLKDERLERALTPFVDAPESKCTDYPQYMNRDYVFIYPVERGVIKIFVSAYVAEENPTCRKILVDRKTVTRVEEVYKLSCDGDIVEADPVNLKLEA